MTIREYNIWCIKNNFESKLLKATKARKNAVKAAETLAQSSLDPHLKECKPKKHVVPYSNSLFISAATEWPIAMDQVSTF